MKRTALFCVLGVLTTPAAWGTEAPRVGELAPTFKLKSLDGQSEMDLTDFRGNKPVVLFFGSYT